MHIEGNMQKLQDIVTELMEGGFYGVEYWTNLLNEKLERILLTRVDEILDAFVINLDEDWDVQQTRLSELEDGDEDNPFIRKAPIKHSVRITNNMMQVQPPMADAKMALGQDLQLLLGMLAGQLKPTHELKDADGRELPRETFKSMVAHINTGKLVMCYRKIEQVAHAATDYCDTWTSYQVWNIFVQNFTISLQ